MRLRLTKRTDYAIRACLLLAGTAGVPVSSRRIAERMSIPDHFLPQILADLSRAGIVCATQGTRGGYALARDGAALTLLEVIEAVEGPSRSEHCVLEERTCAPAGACALHPVWSAAQSAFIDALATATVGGIVAGVPSPNDERRPVSDRQLPDPVGSSEPRRDEWTLWLGPRTQERIPT